MFVSSSVLEFVRDKTMESETQDVAAIRTVLGMASGSGSDDDPVIENVVSNNNQYNADINNSTLDDLKRYDVEHLMKFLTSEDVMALGQTCVKWRDICQPEWRKKKPEEMSAAWSRYDHIPTAEEVASVELLVAHGLLTSQIITGKVAAVSQVWSRNHYFPTESEVAFVALLASNGHGQIPEQILASKANELTELLSIFFFNPSLPLVAAAAALATHGYITHVVQLGLYNLDLDLDVSAGNLANLVQCVSTYVWISRIRGDLGPVFGTAKCSELNLVDMDLSTAETQSLLGAMVSGVRLVFLCRGVTLDMETLSQYDGKGECGRVWVWEDTGRRYRGQLKSWMQRIGWKLKRENDGVIEIERSG